MTHGDFTLSADGYGRIKFGTGYLTSNGTSHGSHTGSHSGSHSGTASGFAHNSGSMYGVGDGSGTWRTINYVKEIGSISRSAKFITDVNLKVTKDKEGFVTDVSVGSCPGYTGHLITGAVENGWNKVLSKPYKTS